MKENHWASGESLKKVTDTQKNFMCLPEYNGGRPLPEGARLSTANGDLIVAGTLYDCPFDRGKSDWTLICSEETFSALAGESGYTILDIQLDRSSDDDDSTPSASLQAATLSPTSGSATGRWREPFTPSPSSSTDSSPSTP